MTAVVLDGNVAVWWATSVSNMVTGPTVAEIGAATRLDGYITKDGLDLQPDQDAVDDTVLSSTAETSDHGMRKMDAKLTMLKDTTPWAAFASNPTGYLIVRRDIACDTAAAAGQKVQIYKLKAADRVSLKPAKNELSKFEVKMANRANFKDETTVQA